MAQMRISQTFADGTEFEVDLYADESFPDAISEVCAGAVRAFRELTTETVE